MKNLKERIKNSLTYDDKRGIRFVAQSFRSNDRELYDYLVDLHNKTKYKTLHEFVYVLYYGKQDLLCCVCKTNTRKFNKGAWKYNRTCSRSCSNVVKNKESLLKDPDYYKKIAEKSSKSKNSKFIDGKNMHQISAERAAANRNQKATNAKISEIKRRQRHIRTIQFKKRVQKLIDYFGVVRFSKIFVRTKYNGYFCYEYIQKLLCDVLGENYNLLCSSYDYGFLQFYVEEIRKEKLIKLCEICGKKYSNYDIDGVLKYSNKNCCCKSCATKLYFQKHGYPDYSKRPAISPENRRKISDNLVRRWSKVSLEDKKKFAAKILKKMETDIIDGKNGIERRTIKASKTKIERGLINNFNDYSEDEYHNYRRKVTCETNKQDLGKLPNFDKRGKRSYHLDHIFPISKGFMYKIPAKLIGNIKNLQMLRASENRTKNDKIVEIPKHIKIYLEENGFENFEELV